ncbi:MAG: phytanoyl-CoA dioxygenase family protein [Acidobacteria bacterium]|nr:phytanoyl-CoA dioxygenase family protein [Acidobacteriota bacterium]
MSHTAPISACATDLADAFRRTGFASVPGFVRPDELVEVERQLARYVRDVVPGLSAQDAFYEVKGRPETLKQLHRMIDNDAWFHEFFLSERFLGLAGQLLGAAAVPKNVEYFAKPPRIGAPTPPHQDGHYFMIEPNEALTMWIALDDIDEINGCIRYVEGSHLKGLRPHAKSGVLGFSQGITDYGPADQRAETPMLSRPGDMHVHHSMTIHRADANQSDRPRRALGLVCYSERARHDAEKSAAYQRELARRLRDEGKI